MSLLAAMNTMKVTSQQLNIQGSGAGILESGHDAMNNFVSVSVSNKLAGFMLVL